MRQRCRSVNNGGPLRHRFTSYHPAGDAEAAVTDGTRLGGLPHWLAEPQWPVDPYENELAAFMG